MNAFTGFLEFVFFSMLESYAIVAIMLAIFRFKASDYMWSIVLLTLTMSLQSYVLREELALSILVPIINLVLLTFFTMNVLRVPLIWSTLISAFGSVMTILFQVFLVAISGKPIEWFQEELYRVYVMQSVTGIIGIVIAFSLYKFGIGLSFSFEKHQPKWERSMLYSLVGVIVIGFVVLASQRSVYIDIVFLLITLLFFIFYTIRKETEND
ncbi:hypothetical protein [Cohnella terricola]|uniref:Uncharacterized protein n=1 Tax=Cohnella terricola TaxID=1289167 RepID=A0A559IVB1_9BACL|nr:hypothetical protein [Cohnella terricola]TVX91536.1 hypothetical protein FPZ45_24810 [Cohnella terricola]